MFVHFSKGTKEGSDVTLNCSQPRMDLRDKVFDWKKDSQEVFFYGKGKHYNNGKDGQHDHYKKRVEFFEDELEFGNASILIKNTKLTDSGNYSCGFPVPPVVNHTLVVGKCRSFGPILKEKNNLNNIP